MLPELSRNKKCFKCHCTIFLLTVLQSLFYWLYPSASIKSNGPIMFKYDEDHLERKISAKGWEVGQMDQEELVHNRLLVI